MASTIAAFKDVERRGVIKRCCVYLASYPPWEGGFQAFVGVKRSGWIGELALEGL